MRAIRQEEIVGARITRIHSKLIPLDSPDTLESNAIAIYFTVDRGFSFTLPSGRDALVTAEVPHDAKEEPDSHVVKEIDLGRRWFGRIKITPWPPEICDEIRQVKQKTIAGIFCLRDEMRLESGLASSLIGFNDGSQAYTIGWSPDGIPDGLFLLNREQAIPMAELLSVFELAD